MGSGPPVAVTQRGQQAIIIHHDGREELIIEVDYQSAQAPPSLAWVIPLPSIPDRYEITSPTLFEEMEQAAELNWGHVGCRSRGPAQQSAPIPTSIPALNLLEVVAVGPYTIQPIQASGELGLAALGRWMTDNGFSEIPEEELAYYIQRQWVFLAVRATPPEGGEMGTAGALPPLHISFLTSAIVYPLKLSAHMGVFPVTLYVLTDHAVEREVFRGARERGFFVSGANEECDDLSARQGCECNDPFLEAAAQFTLDGREALTELFGSLGLVVPAPHLTVLHTPTFGEGAASPAEWAEDFILPLPSAPESP
jgi:hypothetical protein